MTLPSLEEPSEIVVCPRCGYQPVRVEGFCPDCFEFSLEAREQLIEAQLDEAKFRTRAWKHARKGGDL